MLLKVYIVDGKQGRLGNPKSVMVNQSEKGLIARNCDWREEFFNLLLGHVFRNVRGIFHKYEFRPLPIRRNWTIAKIGKMGKRAVVIQVTSSVTNQIC